MKNYWFNVSNTAMVTIVKTKDEEDSIPLYSCDFEYDLEEVWK